MSFLASICAGVAEWLLTKLGNFFVALWQKLAKRHEIEKSAEESVDPLKKAVTGDEIDKATDDALRKF